MSSVFIARQPIVDANGDLFAYELLFRDLSSDKNRADLCERDDLYATSRVAVNALNQFGVERLVGGGEAFINADREFILGDFITMLPKERFYIEILEDVKIESSLVERVEELHSLGYRFALDDMTFSEDFIKEYEAILPFIEIVKIDIRDSKIELVDRMIERLASCFHLKFLAEKVESLDEFKLYKAAGCTLFQGYFFSKPEIKKKSSLDPSKSTLLELTGLLLDENSDPNEIAAAFERAPDLSLQLIQFLNSARFSFKKPIRSISHAVMMIGRKDLLTWIYMLAYVNGNISKIERSPLVALAGFRSRLLRRISMMHGDRKEVQDMAAFTGTLSLADTIFEMPMESLLERMRIDGAVKTALLAGKGTLAEYLKLAKSVERGEDEEYRETVKRLGLNLFEAGESIVRSYE